MLNIPGLLKKLFPKKLAQVLPLYAPISVHLDPSNICNFKCIFCPTGDNELLSSVNRPKGKMDFELFCKIIDDMKDFKKKIKILHLYKDGEPLMNKYFCKMVSYAKRKKVAKSIRTTSNGVLLNHSISIELIESGLDMIRFSIEHVNNEKYKEITKTYSNYDQIKKNIEFLFKEKQKRKSKLKIFVKILDVNLSENDKKKFLEDFEPISDMINIDTIMGWSLSEQKDFTLGKDIKTGMNSKDQLEQERLVCPEPFRAIAINFDGSVTTCCVDWSHGNIIGNVREQSIQKIWNSKKLNYIRKLHLKGERNLIPVCKNCQYMQGFDKTSDLDNYVEDLIIKF